MLLSNSKNSKVMTTIFPNGFLKVTLITSIWINASEVFRYFVIVMPKMREHLAVVPNVAPMNWWVFSIWGVWDTILTASIVFITWLCLKTYGRGTKTIFVAGLTSWATLFLLFWVGMVNMNLSDPDLLLFTLPLSWIETTIGAWIAARLLKDA
jgi:hypothetical protein